MADIKIGIVGASGYTGSELVRLLTYHPDASIEFITSESHAGKKFSDLHNQFKDVVDKKLISLKEISKYKPDVVFLALPHRVSMDFVKEHATKPFKIIDLSGDFRLTSAALYEKWYGKEHVAPGYLKNAAYGLPELFRSKIRKSKLIANPGCYPTSAILALAPLIKNKMVNQKGIVVDSKSGVTGAGAKPKESTHFPDVFGNFSAYGLTTHRHTPEIENSIKRYTNNKIEVIFTPHLLPIDRGILTTTYTKPISNKIINDETLFNAFDTFYKKEQFVRVVNEPPSIKDVRGSNYCNVFAKYDERTKTVITVSVIDNLVKGASGQAIHNMNIAMNLIERTGLKALPLSP